MAVAIAAAAARPSYALQSAEREARQAEQTAQNLRRQADAAQRSADKEQERADSAQGRADAAVSRSDSARNAFDAQRAIFDDEIVDQTSAMWLLAACGSSMRSAPAPPKTWWMCVPRPLWCRRPRPPTAPWAVWSMNSSSPPKFDLPPPVRPCWALFFAWR